jgi:hypothetical protein
VCARWLADKLAQRSGERFRVIASVSERNGTLRFHKHRRGESRLGPSLEEYDEALLVIDTDG